MIFSSSSQSFTRMHTHSLTRTHSHLIILCTSHRRCRFLLLVFFPFVIWCKHNCVHRHTQRHETRLSAGGRPWMFAGLFFGFGLVVARHWAVKETRRHIIWHITNDVKLWHFHMDVHDFTVCVWRVVWSGATDWIFILVRQSNAYFPTHCLI